MTRMFKFVTRDMESRCRLPALLFLLLGFQTCRNEAETLGATIESNRDYGVSKAPSPRERYEAMSAIAWCMKFLSIKPIMDFDFEEFSMWIKDIKPGIVELGADNYGNRLPEPEWSKVELLLNHLKRICTVKEKEGLSRLQT